MEPWLEEGLTALITGLGTVFAVLILVSILISYLKYINVFDKNHKKQESKEQKESIVIEETDNNIIDDFELVAVITAAIAASLNTSTDKLLVKSFKRLPNSRNNLIRK